MYDAHLPPRAKELCARIEALLAEAEPLLEGAANSADVYALCETQERYYPDTLAAYAAVPGSMRGMPDGKGQTPDMRLVRSLETLERAARAHLQNLARARTASLENNQGFLAARFAASAPTAADAPLTDVAPGAPAAPAPAARPSAPQALLRQFFSNLAPGTLQNPYAALEAMGARFGHVFPQFTTVRRALFRRTVDEVIVALPTSNGAVEYSVALREGTLRATAARVAHGIRVRTEETTVEHLLTALMEHLLEHAERDRDARRQLERAFGRGR